MSPAHKYKKMENKVVDSSGRAIRIFFNGIVSFFKFFVRKGRQQFTVMFIPHSEKKIFNFHISVFSLLFFMCLIIILVISFIGLSTYFTQADKRFTRVENSLKLTETDLDTVKEEIVEVERSWKMFRHNMEELLAILGTEDSKQFLYKGRGGNLSSFEDIELEVQGALKEISELRSIRAYLNNVIKPLEDIKKTLKSQKELLIDIPTLWPVSRGKGNITAVFGIEKNPFTKGFRLHNGVDLAWSYNTPIVAAANGKVHSVLNKPNGLGRVVRIVHKYGFTTVYGHLSRPTVEKGDNITRGQIIGYMGTTGLSTGPHLHYEVWMGTQVVDPMHFLDIRSPLVEKYSYKR